jgi:hypothetical protein
MQIFQTHDPASKIGASIGTLIAVGVYGLMAYGLFLGLFY